MTAQSGEPAARSTLAHPGQCVHEVGGCDVTAVLIADTYVLKLYIVKFLKV